MSSTSAFVFLGVLIAVLGIPMARRKVPPNRFYGLRVAATFADKRVWYEANAKSGRDMIIVGIAIAVLAVILSWTSLPKQSSALILGISSAAAVIAAALRGWRFAERLLRDLKAT